MKKKIKKVLNFLIIIIIMLMPNYIYAAGDEFTEVEKTVKVAASEDWLDDDDTIYKQPESTQGTKKGADLDNILSSGNEFINSGSNSNVGKVNDSELQSLSSTIFSILSQIAVVVAVIIGAVLGIQFMMGSVEEKANIKELLVPYGIGCVVVFGALGIWALVVNMLQGAL